jgi:hypothetical protein
MALLSSRCPLFRIILPRLGPAVVSTESRIIIPLDKFRPENVLKFAHYRLKVSLFQDHSRWNFLDEKHLVNKDTLPNRVRACPLTGRVPAIPVSGDFREAYNLFAIISTNPDKPYPIDYMIGRENGNAASFIAFIEYLIGTHFFFS